MKSSKTSGDKVNIPSSPHKWGSAEAAIIRDMIFRESEYIDHRLTWMVTLQGLLLAGLGFAWKDGKELIPILGSLGLATSISTGLSLYYAVSSIEALFTEWDERQDQSYLGPDVIIYKHKGMKFVKLLLPWFFLPLAFIVAWVAVMVIHYSAKLIRLL